MSTVCQRTIQLPLRLRKLLIVDITRLQPFIIGGDSFCEHVEALISYNVRNDGQQQDCLYIEQGHLMTPTSFMSYSMAIDPRRSVVVTSTPIPLSSTLPLESQHWCPLESPSSTSSYKCLVIFSMPEPTRPKAGKALPCIVFANKSTAERKEQKVTRKFTQKYKNIFTNIQKMAESHSNNPLTMYFYQEGAKHMPPFL